MLGRAKRDISLENAIFAAASKGATNIFSVSGWNAAAPKRMFSVLPPLNYVLVSRDRNSPLVARSRHIGKDEIVARKNEIVRQADDFRVRGKRKQMAISQYRHKA